MHPSPDSPVSDPARLAALEATGFLSDPSSEVFDRLTRLVELCLRVPVALVSLVAEDRQVFASQRGLAEPWCSAGETPLSHSFCQHVVARDAPLVVEDARRHPLLRDNLAIPDLDVVAYLGIPVRTPSGHVLGSLCAIAGTPRSWTPADIEVLEALAETAMAEVATRSRLDAEAAALRDALGRGGALFRTLFHRAAQPAFVLGVADTAVEANAAALAGRPREAVVGRPVDAALLDVHDVSGTGLRLALGPAD